tara:strand:- start:128 stop:463 length:336 start_codon:yes stop_codon:yes gene_type:complete
MSVLDSFYKTIMNFFIDEKFNKEQDKLETCMLDDDPVDCFTFDLEDKGFVYNDITDWWERTWSVKTKTGEETSKEVYKKEGSQWKSMMFGNDGELFYEQTVGTRTDGHTTI